MRSLATAPAIAALALSAALLALLLVPATAFAHAEPAIAKPGDGAVLNGSPGQIEIEMSQEMARQAGANDIVVVNEAGEQVTLVAAVIDNANRKRLTVPLPAELPPGTYTVQWKTLSAEDGDPSDGELSFTIDPDATPSPGQENLREDIAPPPAETETPAAERPSTASPLDGGGGGTSWVLVTAVAVGCLVLGSGTTFLLVQKKG